MDMSTVKVILALAAMWGVPVNHSDIPNAYGKAEKKSNLEILLQVTQEMDISDDTLKILGVAHRKEVVLQLKNSM